MNITQLAQSMNVSETDLMCLAQSVANSIEQDKAAKSFVNMSEEDRVKMTEAYVVYANKKMQEFVTIYQLNTAARSSFSHKIFADLKGIA